jgi:hypothetical protein
VSSSLGVLRSNDLVEPFGCEVRAIGPDNGPAVTIDRYLGELSMIKDRVADTPIQPASMPADPQQLARQTSRAFGLWTRLSVRRPGVVNRRAVIVPLRRAAPGYHQSAALNPQESFVFPIGRAAAAEHLGQPSLPPPRLPSATVAAPMINRRSSLACAARSGVRAERQEASLR